MVEKSEQRPAGKKLSVWEQVIILLRYFASQYFVCVLEGWKRATGPTDSINSLPKGPLATSMVLRTMEVT
jgi:hypothetical protein